MSNQLHPPPPVFVLLSFEGPDHYARAGGLATRIMGLADVLSGKGFETHLFFVGDPALPAHQVLKDGKLHLHRWCQWISRYYPAGVYDGQEGKVADWTASLPAWLETHVIGPKVAAGSPVIVMGEDWQTAGSLVSLGARCISHGWQSKVHCLWNANNTFGFHRIDWTALSRVATATTVSRYMKHVMWGYGVDARVIPNGIDAQWLRPVGVGGYLTLGPLLRGRTVLVKMARWDPDKRWIMAVEAVAVLKRWGWRPLFLARGGAEPHGEEVLRRAQAVGLSVEFASCEAADVRGLTTAITAAQNADMVVLRDYLSEEQRRFLLQAAHAVLANSGVEPFGLVGLETMAVGGVALVGSTGEDYVTPAYDAVSLQTSEPLEIVQNVLALKSRKGDARRMRRAARKTAARYVWQSVLERHLLPFVSVLHVGVPLNASHIPVQGNGTPSPAPTMGNGSPHDGALVQLTIQNAIPIVWNNAAKDGKEATMEREQAIAELAYDIWEREGCPEGCAEEHWSEAQAQWERQNTGESPPETPMAGVPAAEPAPKRARRSSKATVS